MTWVLTHTNPPSPLPWVSESLQVPFCFVLVCFETKVSVSQAYPKLTKSKTTSNLWQSSCLRLPSVPLESHISHFALHLFADNKVAIQMASTVHVSGCLSPLSQWQPRRVAAVSFSLSSFSSGVTCMFMCVSCTCLVPVEARRGSWIPRWSYFIALLETIGISFLSI